LGKPLLSIHPQQENRANVPSTAEERPGALKAELRKREKNIFKVGKIETIVGSGVKSEVGYRIRSRFLAENICNYKTIKIL